MASLPSHRTLYDDWQFRRDQLFLRSGGIESYRQIQLRVLDFLLRRYRNAPEAKRPVPAALSGEVHVNDRAIVVHHHLAFGGRAKASSSAEARLHIKAALERMYSAERAQEPDSAVCPDKGAVEGDTQRQDPDPLRLKLCHSDPVERILGTVEIGEHGTLRDIGLLCDLLALPPAGDEHPRERAALSHAIARLAGLTSADFDLTDVLPPPTPATDDWICSKCDEVVPAGFDVCRSCGTTFDGKVNGWICSNCEEVVPTNFDVCWSCGTTIGGKENPTFSGVSEENGADRRATGRADRRGGDRRE